MANNDPIIYYALYKNGGSLFPNNQEMAIGQYLQSPSGRYRMLLDDGFNLKIYDNGMPIWAADSSVPYTYNYELDTHKGRSYVQMANAALAIADFYNKRHWQTATSRTIDYTQPGRTIGQLQDDGNLVLVRYQALWSSDLNLPLVPEATSVLTLPPGFKMEQGREYKIGPITFVFQGDGNLVSYDANMRALWNAGTPNQGGDTAIMQGDGNFVIYNSREGRAIWNTQTSGNNGAYAIITDNGRFTVLKDGPIWARFGFTPEGVSVGGKIRRGVNLGTAVNEDPYFKNWSFHF